VAGAVAAFLVVWATLLVLQRNVLRPLRDTPRFPTPPQAPSL
jgi:hypothetical protein